MTELRRELLASGFLDLATWGYRLRLVLRSGEGWR